MSDEKEPRIGQKFLREALSKELQSISNQTELELREGLTEFQRLVDDRAALVPRDVERSTPISISVEETRLDAGSGRLSGPSPSATSGGGGGSSPVLTVRMAVFDDVAGTWTSQTVLVEGRVQ